MERLPTEIVVHIFSFLTTFEKYLVSKVCSSWSDIVICKCLWTKAVACVGEYDSNFKRWIVLRDVRRLHLTEDFDFRMFRPKTEYVKCATYERLRPLLQSRTQTTKVRSLCIDDCSQMKNVDMEYLVHKMSQLEKLTLMFASRVSSNAMYSIVKGLKKLRILQLDHVRFTEADIEIILKSDMAHRLTKLTLRNLWLTHQHLYANVLRKCKRLVKLELDYSRELTITHFNNMMTNLGPYMTYICFYVKNFEKDSIRIKSLMYCYFLSTNGQPRKVYIFIKRGNLTKCVRWKNVCVQMESGVW